MRYLDYLELMSQLLERWMGDPQVLEILQGDSPTLSADEMASFLQAKFFNALREEKFRVAGSMFGLRAYADYTAEEIADAAFDPLALYNQSLEEYYLSPMSESSIPTPNGYLSRFRPFTVISGQRWSQTISLRSSGRAEDGFMNRELGQRLKEIIYTNSYDYDATTDIERFLGRRVEHRRLSDPLLPICCEGQPQDKPAAAMILIVAVPAPRC